MDLIVIGAGTAGREAALEAARQGARVTLVDPLDPDGSASSAGAAPLAALREITRLRGATPPRLESMREFAVQRAEQRAHASVHLLEHCDRAGVSVARGRATIESPQVVRVAGERALEADAIIIATGTDPRRPATLPFDDDLVCDCQTFLRRSVLPPTVLVLGAEEEGCEFACLLAAMGAHVTLVERRQKLFRSADRDVLGHLHDGLRSAGITVVNGEHLRRMRLVRSSGGSHVSVAFSSGRVEISELAIVVGGRVPRIPHFTDAAPVALDERGFIVVDDRFATSVGGIFAIGDVTGPPFRIGSALFQARAAVAAALGGTAPPLPDLPTAIHTIPQIATVGLGEDVARRLGLDIQIGIACEGDLEVRAFSSDPLRLLKLVFEAATGRLLGVQIAGGAAAELINLGAALITLGASASGIASGIFSHPSQGDAYRVAASATLVRGVTSPPPENLEDTSGGESNGEETGVSPW